MRQISGKNVEMSDNEFAYYEHLCEKLSDPEKNVRGADYFDGLFETDEQGYVVQIKPEKSVPWAVIFFVQQLMINQRLRMVEVLGDKLLERDEAIRKLEDRLDVMQNEIDEVNYK